MMVFMLSSAFAQTRIGSPYTRYGLGDLMNSKYMRSMSMGGTSYGFRNAYSVNYSNPASYTAFDSLSFVFETGINSSITQLKSLTQKQTSNYSSLSYIAFGFPISRWWGASIGLLPYSNVGYKILDKEYIENIGNTEYLYEGAGGINQFYLGNAFRIKNLSVGCNSSVLFGSLDRVRTVSFPDSSYYLRTKLLNSVRVNSFLFNYGMQYKVRLSEKVKMVAGLVYNLNTDLNAKQDSLAYRFFHTTLGTESVKDTIINSMGNKGTLTLPQSIGFGVTFGIGEKWLVGADFQTQNWNKYSSFGESDSLANSMQASFGLEMTPDNLAVTGRWKRAHYRFGARYNQTYLQLNNTQLNEYGVSFGLGLPMKKSKTTLNLGFELGQRGTTDNNLIKESFARVIFSLSVHEYWFFKRRFD